MRIVSVASILLMGLSVLLLLGISTAHVESQETDKLSTWEHLALTQDVADGVNVEAASRQINGLGKDGWELVDVETLTKNGGTTEIVYFFKKRQ